MSDARTEGLKVVSEILSPEMADAISKSTDSKEFAGYIGELSLHSVFGRVWARPGLDRRARSLVTLGILIALRAADELSIHFVVAIRNGVTVQELEEVIYQASGYAGFPAAASARNIALKALRQAQIID
jgi:4-carboxymuconolactone decarboxylase